MIVFSPRHQPTIHALLLVLPGTSLSNGRSASLSISYVRQTIRRQLGTISPRNGRRDYVQKIFRPGPTWRAKSITAMRHGLSNQLRYFESSSGPGRTEKNEGYTSSRFIRVNSSINGLTREQYSPPPPQTPSPSTPQKPSPVKTKIRSRIVSSLSSTARENIYTIPNTLTFSRLIAAPIIGYLVLTDQHAWAFGLFAYAGITDLIDGYIARTWRLQTVVGTVIDPMADKTLMTVLTVCLAIKGLLPGWFSVCSSCSIRYANTRWLAAAIFVLSHAG